MTETIGFVGVGRMGSRMATNLLDAGYEVYVYDVDAASVDAMEERGALPTDSVSDVAASVDLLCTSLPNAEIVEDVYLGDGGVVESIADGSAVVEMSTVPPASVEAIVSAFEARDVAVVDCPVIGPPPDAEAGTLTIVAGCDEPTFNRIEPVLSHLGDRVERVDTPGDAKRIKLANNVITFGNFAVAAETFALVERMGIDPEFFFDITDSGAAHASIVSTKAPKGFSGDFEPDFSIEDARKDLQYALEMKEAADFPASIAALVAESYTLAAAVGEGDSDYSVLIDVLENR